MERILRILEEDCRVSAAEIARRIGATEEQVKEAIAQAEADGTILGYSAIVNWAKVSPDRVYAFISVSATPQRDIGFDEVARRIAGFPEVHSVYLVSGTSDLTVVVEADDFREIASFVAEKLAPLPGVNSTATSFVLKIYKIEGKTLEGPERQGRLAITP
ncbi:MAG: Lrp/AsnC family transcriptional regulator [Armatimonadetes bacterium]|nr:Lrp/AsnC family transcriptional regulator [Armatimonadota bacterium]